MMDRDDLLQRLLTDEVSRDDPEVRRLLAEDPELEAELERHDGVGTRLDSAGAAQRSTVAHAGEAQAPAAAQDALEAALRSVLEPRPRRRSPLLVLAGLAAAAAASLLAYALLGTRDAATSPPDPAAPYYLSRDDPALTAELGPDGRLERFTWTLTPPPGGYFRVVVRAADDEGTLLHETGRLRTASWTPTALESADWPDAIVWEVEVYDATGTLSGTSSPDGVRVGGA